MIKEQGFFINIYTMHGNNQIRVMFDDNSKPISADQLNERYEYFKQAHGCSANPEVFKLVVPLKTYYVRLDV